MTTKELIKSILYKLPIIIALIILMYVLSIADFNTPQARSAPRMIHVIET